jgi:peptide/nickel transport system permease protein
MPTWCSSISFIMGDLTRRPHWGRLVLRRSAHALIVVCGVVFLSFLAVRVLPGDPAVVYAGSRASADQLQQVHLQLGLDRPLIVQFWHYLTALLQGDLGTSLATRRPVAEDLTKALPASLVLTCVALAVGVPLGIAAGVVSARFHGRLVDRAIQAISLLAVALPVFWLAVMLQDLFASKLGWLPAAGQVSPRLADAQHLPGISNAALVDAIYAGNPIVLVDTLIHLILPAIVVAAYPFGLLTQLLRSSLIEQLQAPYATLARAYGVGERRLVRSYTLRPALTPIVGIGGLVLGSTLVGAALAEEIFNWPGVGTYLVTAIRSLDINAVVGTTIVVGVLYVVVNFISDLWQAKLDPRIQVE